MAKAGASKNYRGGQKNNWRRMVWNEVLRRTAGREQTELILYLAGPQDLDRDVAISKGVPPENLIAIDVCAANVSSTRAKGASAVNGDALDVLWSWPDDRAVCAVLLDFCSGLENANCGIYDAFERRSLRNAVVMVNFMRGRDPWSNQIRSHMKSAGLGEPLWKVSGSDAEPEMVAEANHRAAQFLKLHAWHLWSVTHGTLRRLLGAGGPVDIDGFDTGTDGGPVRFVMPPADAAQSERDQFVALVSNALNGMEPRFFSYRSGSLRFDSAVFVHHARFIDVVSAAALASRFAAAWRRLMGHHEKTVARRAAVFKLPKLVRRLAAMFAVRTTRLRRAS